MHVIGILSWPYRGFLFFSLYHGPVRIKRTDKKGFAYLPTVWLASCRIRLNCFFIFVFFSALTPTGGNIPHYFSQYNDPCSTEAQHTKSNVPCLPSFIAGCCCC